MPRSRGLRRVCLFVAVTASCGFGTLSNEVLDVAAFRQELRRVTVAVDDHRDGSTSDDCAAALASYAAAVRQALQRLAPSAQTLDACLVEMGHPSTPTMQSTIALMNDELDVHDTAACADDDAETEDERHAERMFALLAPADATAARLEEMLSGEMPASCELAPP